MFEQTVDGQLIRLIESLRGGVPELKDFYLAGGTALALHQMLTKIKVKGQLCLASLK